MTQDVTVWLYHSPPLPACKEKPKQHPISSPSHLSHGTGMSAAPSPQPASQPGVMEAASHQNTRPAKKAKLVGLPDPAANWTGRHQSAALTQAAIWWGFGGGKSAVVFELCL